MYAKLYPFTFINKEESSFCFLKQPSTVSVEKCEKNRFSAHRMDLFDTGVLERTDVQNLFCNPQFLGLWKTEKGFRKVLQEMSLKNVFAFFFLEQWYDVKRSSTI